MLTVLRHRIYGEGLDLLKPERGFPEPRTLYPNPAQAYTPRSPFVLQPASGRD